jgi:flagellin
MSLTVNSNIAALNAQRNLSKSSLQLNQALSRLSSGLRINSAKDDAAGLAISDRFTSQIRGLNQAVRNANDGISLSQTAEGALQESTNLLQRLRELAVQSANDTNAASDRKSLQDEVEQIKSELNRIANTTEFNGRKLLDGSALNLNFHVGARESQTITFSVKAAGATDLGNNSVTAKADAAGGANGAGAAVDAAAALPSANGIAAQNLTVSGSEGTEVIAVGAGNTAEEIATEINDVAASTGVTASAKTTVTLDNLEDDGTVTFTLGSGDDTSVIRAAVTTSDLSGLADEINKTSGTTGVTAEVENGTLTLIQAQGKDIQIENYEHSAGNDLDVAGAGGNTITLDGNAANASATDSTVVSGVITLSSSEAFTASSNVANTAGSIFGAAADAVQSSTESLVSAIDITSQTGANDALAVVDAAIASIDSIRSGLGAVQNRFESTIANLQNVAENVSAARSRIQDADFAQETAALTKAQILQQAGTAILAQANQVPQGALSLLQ